MINLRETIEVPRLVDDVFSYVSNFANAAQWDPGVAEATKTSPGRIGVGTVFNLRVRFGGPGGFTAVDGLSLQVASGEVLGLVGESGSGKSVAMLALMGLVDAPGQVLHQKLALSFEFRERTEAEGQGVSGGVDAGDRQRGEGFERQERRSQRSDGNARLGESQDSSRFRSHRHRRAEKHGRSVQNEGNGDVKEGNRIRGRQREQHPELR